MILNYNNFDWKLYKNKYSDLSIINNKHSAWSHWINFGKKEGRKKCIITTPENKYITKDFFENNYTIYITRHMNDNISQKYWIHNYNCIRANYQKINIVIIDDNSHKIYSDMDKNYNVNATIIYSDFNKRGELLPFYYYYKNNPTPYAIFIHDSVFIQNEIHTLIFKSNYIPLWSFSSISWHNKLKNNIIDVTSKLKYGYELLNIYRDISKWDGTFGCMCVISNTYLNLLNTEFNFIPTLLKIIDNRDKRMCFERILSLMYYKINKNDMISLFGNIHEWSLNTYNEMWGLTWKEYLISKNLKEKMIIKVWTGR